MSTDGPDSSMQDKYDSTNNMRGTYAQRDAERLTETEHLLRSSKNAERLQAALDLVKAETTLSQTIDELRQEVGLSDEE